MPHDIRLAGPWEYSTPNNEPWVRCQLPWNSPAGVAEVILRRKFHRPSGLNENSRVKVLIYADATIPSVRLNGEIVAVTVPLLSISSKSADESPVRENCFDVSMTLQEFNTVEVELVGANSTRIDRAVLRILD